jgi:glutamate dehydrogenase
VEEIMQAKNEESVAHLLNDVVEFARGRLPEPAFTIVEPFLRHYYDFVDADDLQSRAIADLYGAALAHWQTAQRFVPGSERLRVYNPILEQHGWHSDHTVIEIVNDDMPFLVDSVSMAVNRLGLALHSVVHPVFRIWRGADGSIVRVGQGAEDAGDKQSQLASFIHFEVAAAATPPSSMRCVTISPECWATCAPRWKTGRRSSRLRVPRSRI